MFVFHQLWVFRYAFVHLAYDIFYFNYIAIKNHADIQKKLPFDFVITGTSLFSSGSLTKAPKNMQLSPSNK